jgi:hypothetical protein
MSKHLRDFIHKTLTSRKFWAAVTASAPFAQIGDWNSFSMVWVAYAGIQGAVDASEGLGSKRAIDTLTLTGPETETDAPVPRVPSGDIDRMIEGEG